MAYKSIVYDRNTTSLEKDNDANIIQLVAKAQYTIAMTT